MSLYNVAKRRQELDGIFTSNPRLTQKDSIKPKYENFAEQNVAKSTKNDQKEHFAPRIPVYFPAHPLYNGEGNA